PTRPARATGELRDLLTGPALHRCGWRPRAPDLLVHAARDGAAGGGVRTLARGLLGRTERGRAVAAAAELHAHATLHLGPRGGHEEEQRRHGEHGGDGVEGGALQRRLLLPAAAGRGSGSRNCCCSVDPSIAVTDDTPPVAIWVTSSK